MTQVIAVDGPAGSGKGTMARGLAGRFSFAHLDTGLMYRAFGWKKVTFHELAKMKISDYNELLENLDEAELRGEEAGKMASDLGADPHARKEITRLQREFVEEKNAAGIVCILDGRDIGTAVFPDAVCKFFVTAELKIRALRRFAALRAESPDLTLSEVEEALAERDDQDKHRKHSPLKTAEDYVVIDTSGKTESESLEEMAQVVGERLRLAHR